MDALFGRKVSPSRKYKEFAQDDTNHGIKGPLGRPREWDGEQFEPRHRSNSLSFDKDFLDRYELLPDEEEQDLLRPVKTSYLMEPVDIVPKRQPDQEYEPTDTFSGRRQRTVGEERQDPSLKFKVPSYDDPLLSQLLGKETRKDRAPTRANIPGKYPSPSKRVEIPSSNRPSGSTKDYTDEYIKLLDQLDLNGQNLKGLQQDLEYQHQQHQHQESSYREKYVTIRHELITELKQSKKIYDNYYKLYAKYKDLKRASFDSHPLLKRVQELEAQVVDTSISKAAEVRRLNEEMFQFELKHQELQNIRDREKIQYESKIAELESLLQRQLPSPRQNRSPFKDYNTTIDRQFLKNPVTGI